MIKNISIIIPVYNSDKSLLELEKKIKNELYYKNKIQYEIIFVNDFSTNIQTSKILNKLKSKNIKIINLKKNNGQHYATLIGLLFAKNNILVTMDDDLQHHPKYIIHMVKHLNSKNLEVVFGKFKKKKHPFFKNIFSKINNFFIKKIFNLNNKFEISSFRVIKKTLAKKLINSSIYNAYIGCMILNATDKIDNYIVEHNYRKYKKSNYKFTDQLKLFFVLMFDYSNIPLILTAILSLTFCLIGILFAIFIIYKSVVTSGTVPGWASIIFTISVFFTSINLLLLLIGVNSFRFNKKKTIQDRFF